MWLVNIDNLHSELGIWERDASSEGNTSMSFAMERMAHLGNWKQLGLTGAEDVWWEEFFFFLVLCALLAQSCLTL